MTELFHGTWWDLHKNEPPEEVINGRFTQLFPDLKPAHFDPADLRRLAGAMTSKQERRPTRETERDPEEDPEISAAYTYLGQFVDHDLTFDPTSQLREFLNPNADRHGLADFRSPRFDLDNLYGRGPDDQPYMYEPDGIRMLLGEPMSGNPYDPGSRQLPRGPSGRGAHRRSAQRREPHRGAVSRRLPAIPQPGRQAPGRTGHLRAGSGAGSTALPVDAGHRLPAHRRKPRDVHERLP